MYRRMSLVLIVLVALFLTACGTSEEAIATGIAETLEYQKLLDLAKTATAQAGATDTPQPSSTPTETLTPTPEVTATLEPGKGFVPDCIGLQLDVCMNMLEEAGMQGYYVLALKTSEPEGTVYEMDPEPGTVIDMDEDEIKLLVAVSSLTPSPQAGFRGGHPTGKPCGGVPDQGKCIGNVCTYCVFGFLWEWDCSTCGGTCTWSDFLNLYTCDCLSW